MPSTVGALYRADCAPAVPNDAADAGWWTESTSMDLTRIDGVPAAMDRASTGGISRADYDGDGDPDLYVTNGYT